MKLFWFLFALAAVMPLLGRVIGKGKLLLYFLCVLFTCGAVGVCVLEGESLMTAGTGIAAVLLIMLCMQERSGKP